MKGKRLAITAGVALLPATLMLCPWLLVNMFSSTYLPHGFCFQWDPRLVWLHVLSDLIIWISYTAIALMLGMLVHGKDRLFRFEIVVVLFGAFIIACGFTHLLSVVVLWKPLYWLEGDFKLLTALISLITAVVLPFYVPRLKSTLRRAASSAENERRFLAAMESSLDGFYIFESVRDHSGEIVDFRFVFVNAIGVQILGRDQDQIIGYRMCDLVPENRVSGLFDSYKRVVETGEPYADDLLLEQKNVNASWTRLLVVKLDDGIAITASDISERKRHEEMVLEEAGASYREQMEAINRSQMMIEFDMEGNILNVNQNYLRAFGYTGADLTGKHHSIFVTEKGEQSAEFKDLWKDLRRGVFQFGEYSRIGKDGREVWLAASYNPILGADGLPTKVVEFATDITERVAIRSQIREAEARLRAILDNVADGIISIDAVGKILSVNPAGLEMFEYEAGELTGRNVKILMPEPDSSNHDNHIAHYVSTGKSKIIGVGRELMGLAKSGRAFPMELTITEVSLHGQRLFVGLVRDITERKHAEDEGRRAQAFRESLIENSPAAVIVTDPNQMIIAVNPAAQKMLWYQPGDLIGVTTPLIFFDPVQVENVRQCLSADWGHPVTPCEAIFAAGMERISQNDGEWTFLRKGGTTVSVQVTVTPLKSDRGDPTGFMVTAYDVSERKRREEYISHLAHHDVLTGLPTRQLLLDRLDMMLSRSMRYSTKCALLMIDLNDFKQANDSLGHHVGDRLLVEVAERLRAAVRAMDTVARMGGDEFVVLLADLDSEASVELVAAKLLAAFHSPFLLNEQKQFHVTASIGACIYPTGGADAAALLRNADVAMYHAKATGRHSYQTFTQEIANLALRQRELETALRGALEAREMHLHYQPQFSLSDGEMIGVEALLRWDSKQFGAVSPAKFIPLAEQSGLILPIGAWVIRAACEELRRLQERFGLQFAMAVNLSGRQLDQPDLLQVIERALEENGLNPTCLEIEITESMLMTDSPSATAFFDGLRTLGVRVAIDDFGTGFSSMSYLLRFSVDRLKIDRCFIQDACSNPASATVTSAIIALAHQLKVSVVAEGVETEEQMKFLQEAGCDDVQGYLLGRPVPAELIAAPAMVTEPVEMS